MSLAIFSSHLKTLAVEPLCYILLYLFTSRLAHSDLLARRSAHATSA